MEPDPRGGRTKVVKGGATGEREFPVVGIIDGKSAGAVGEELDRLAEDTEQPGLGVMGRGGTDGGFDDGSDDRVDGNGHARVSASS